MLEDWINIDEFINLISDELIDFMGSWMVCIVVIFFVNRCSK